MVNDLLSKSELIIDALQFAHDHDLDVTKKEDVQKILNALDPEQKEDTDEFMQLLLTSDVFLDMQAKANDDKKGILKN